MEGQNEDHKDDVNSSSSSGWTPLHSASASGEVDVVQSLLIKGANVNAVAKDNETPLHLATKMKHCAVIDLLLNHGANVDAVLANGESVLNLAVEMGCLDIIENILKFHPDVNNRSNKSSLILAIKREDDEYREIVQKLFEYGFTVDSYYSNNYGLLWSILTKGYLTILEDLLKGGANVNVSMERRCSLLHVAICKGQMKMTELLINYGADVNATDASQNTPIVCAIEWGCKNACNKRVINEQTTLMPLNKIASINTKKESETATSHFDVNRDHELVEILLKYGAEVNSKAKFDTEVLPQLPPERNYVQIIEMLVHFGADANSLNNNDMNAFHVASIKGCTNAIVALLENGADINIMTRYNHTALDLVTSINPTDIFVCSNYRIKNPTATLIQYLAIMKAKNLFVNENILKKIDAEDNLKLYYNNCEREITEMKNEKIDNSNVSFYDILTKSVHQLAKYARNESIVETLSSSDYQKMFPIYANMIGNQFEKGREREVLLKFSMKYLRLFQGFELPYLIDDSIFSYLNKLDLIYFLKASMTLSHFSEKKYTYH